MKPFRFGVMAESVDAHTRWIEVAREVEALGFTILLVRDHLAADVFGDQLAPIAASMAAAMATSTLRIGTMMLDNDFRHPALLANELATIDQLSTGRLEVGIGAGWLAADYQRTGIPFDRPGIRIDRLAEALTVMKSLWNGGPLTFRGDHYHVDGLVGYPLPIQRPRPPIVIGGWGERMLRLAAREADTVSVLTSSGTTGHGVNDPSERRSTAVAGKIAIVHEVAASRGSIPELSMILDVIITDDRRQETDRFAAIHGWSGLAPEVVWDMPAVAIGTVEGIADQLLQWRERLGVSHFVVSDTVARDFAPVVARLAGR